MTKHDKNEIVPADYAMLMGKEKMARILIQSDQIPASYSKLPNALWVMQKAEELGLKPVQGFEQLFYINGKCSMQVEGMMALVYSSGLMQDIEQFYTGEFPKDSFTAVCKVTRKGMKTVETSFSVADAKLAKLWVLNEQGVCPFKDGRSRSGWAKYPKRMLRKRVFGFAMRDVFPDIVQGLFTVEEAKDMSINYEKPILDPEVVISEISSPEVKKIETKSETNRAEKEENKDAPKVTKSYNNPEDNLKEKDKDQLSPLFRELSSGLDPTMKKKMFSYLKGISTRTSTPAETVLNAALSNKAVFLKKFNTWLMEDSNG